MNKIAPQRTQYLCKNHHACFTLILLQLLVLVVSCAPENSDNAHWVSEARASQLKLAESSDANTEQLIAESEDSKFSQPKTETALLSCQAMNGISVYCGYQNPEDLVLTPSGDALIVSEMGKFLYDTPGRLSMLDLLSGKREPLSIDWTSAGRNWGDENCEAPDIAAFSPHGIDLTTRSDGLHQLLVVNHGKREAVEFFELRHEKERWSLAWQGCALPPGDPLLNDVAALIDGGFLVTHSWNKSTPFEQVIEQFKNGENTGWVWEWQPNKGFNKLAGSDQSPPNGIAVNANNTKIFINLYLDNKTIRIDRASGQVDGAIAVQQPDNVTIDDEGNLWIASHRHDPFKQTCAAVVAGPCLLPFDVIKVDPATMQPEIIFEQNGLPMGFTTVALKVGDRVYMGSAHGDRIASRMIAD